MRVIVHGHRLLGCAISSHEAEVYKARNAATRLDRREDGERALDERR
jgi:hypothetical protein